MAAPASTATTPKSRRFSIRRPRPMSIAVATVVLLVAAGCFLAPYVIYRAKIRAFEVRTNEAADFIEAAQNFFHESGLWPESESEIARAYGATIPSDWEYLWPGYDAGHGPVLRLRGSLHVQLGYAFPENLVSVGIVGWTARGEGDISRIEGPEPPPPVEIVDAKRRKARTLEVLEERLEREPRREDHLREYERERNAP